MADPQTTILLALRDAMAALRHAEEERTRTWAWTALGLTDALATRQARMEAEREVESAKERLRRARGLLLATPGDEKAWGGH